MNVFKKTLLASALVGASVAAHAEFSGNIGVTSEYFYRGASQSLGDAAVSGGLDYASDSGFYLGTWASTLGSDSFAGTEIDFYVGFGGGDMIAYDFGYVYYYYANPAGGIDIDFSEVYGSLGFGPVEVGAAYTVSNDTANDGVGFEEGDLAYWASLGGDVSEDWSLSGTVGRYTFESDGKLTAAVADYTWYGIDLGTSTDLGDFTFSIIDTDVDGQDATAVVSWGTSF